jgi:hypothetical protein
MKTLSKPNKELAQRLITEVGFDDRIIGYQMGKRTGSLPITMYSFQEVAGFLSGNYNVIDFEKLGKWINTVMGDHELASEISAAIKEDQNKKEIMETVRDLLVYRLVQCKKIV